MKNIFKRLREWYSPADPIPGEIWGYRSDRGNPFPDVDLFRVIEVKNGFVQYTGKRSAGISMARSTNLSSWRAVYRKVEDAPEPVREGGGLMI